MLGIGSTELLLILVFGFLLFGPEKAPQLARTIGRFIRQFRTASDEANRKIREEVVDPFQEAIDPYKKEVKNIVDPLKEEFAPLKDELDPLKDDLDSITGDLKKTADAVSHPVKTAANKVKDAFDFDDLDQATKADAAAKASESAASTPLKKAVVAPKIEDPFATAAAESSAAPKADSSSIDALYGLDDKAGE